MQIYENPCETMKVLRGQEAILKSSKGFYGGSKSHLQKSKPTSMQNLSLLFQGQQQLDPQGALTFYHREVVGWPVNPAALSSSEYRGRFLKLRTKNENVFLATLNI